MPTFKITSGTASGKTWKATGVNPKTGRKVTIQGGQKGTKVGPANRSDKTVQSFKARHGTPKTAKQYINKRRWEGGAKIGSTVNVPAKFF